MGQRRSNYVRLNTLALSSSFADAKVIECSDSENSSLKMTASFNSETPSLIASIIFYKPDGSVDHESKTVYVAPTKACDIEIDFKSDCTPREQQGSLSYSYQFSCKTKKVSGEFYVDENGNGSFSCGNQPGSSMFFGCTVH
jgi:hypothetical protein